MYALETVEPPEPAQQEAAKFLPPRHLYNDDKPEDVGEEEEDAPPPVFEMPAPAGPFRSAPPPNNQESELLNRLRTPSALMSVEVNGVGLDLDVIDWNANDTSVMCMLKDSGIRCRIPKSRDVKIVVGGKEMRVAFLGSWHHIAWLGIHVVVFPVVGGAEAPQDSD